MTLDELKATIYDDEFMEKYYDKFREAVKNEEKSVWFRDADREANMDDAGALNVTQVDILRAKGYKVSFDEYSSSQWEVTGWFGS